MYSVDGGLNERNVSVFKIQMVSLFPLFTAVNDVPIFYIVLTKLFIYLSVRRNILRKNS